MGHELAISVTDNQPKKDEVKWGWVVTAAATTINMVTFGVFKSVGLLYIEFPKVYNATKEESAWPGSLMSTIMCLIGPLASILSLYFTIRTLVIFSLLLFATSLCCCYFATTILHITLLFGIFDGIGMGLNFTLLPVLLGQYFEKFRVVSVSIFYAGVPVGSISASFLVHYLIEGLGLKPTFLFMGCLTFLCIFPAFFLTPSEKYFAPKPKLPPVPLEELTATKLEKEAKQQPEEDIPPTSVILMKKFHALTFKAKIILCELGSFFTNPRYVLTVISSAAFFNAFVQLNIVLLDTAIMRGVTKAETLYVLLAFNLPDFFGRLIIAKITYHKICANSTIFNILSIILGISMMLIQYVEGLTKFLIISFVFGLTSGQMLPLPVILVGEFLGESKCAMGFGLLNFFNGILSIFRPFIIGVSTNFFGNYLYVYYIYGFFLLFSVLLWIIYEIKQQLRTTYVTHL